MDHEQISTVILLPAGLGSSVGCKTDGDQVTGSIRYLGSVPASVTQLDACLTGHEIAGSTPPVSNILLWSLIMKYFLRSFSPADSRRAVVSFWRKDVHDWLTA